MVTDPKKPNEFAVFLMDHIFTPIEQQDWRVEKIIVHPQEWATMTKNLSEEQLDVNVAPEIVKEGYVGGLWGASVQTDENMQKGHIEAHYADLAKKMCVCLMTKRLSGAECDNPDCLVDYVHGL